MDNLTAEQRSYCMSRVKGKDTGIERRVRSELHRRGFRFRKHFRQLPGNPDVVFTRARVAVFVDGDFWHGYRLMEWEETLTPFWRVKIRRNVERDKKNHRMLRKSGWVVIRLWQHDIERNLQRCIDRIATAVEERSA